MHRIVKAPDTCVGLLDNIDELVIKRTSWFSKNYD
jgi:hypothetical protein